jgi:hypothetical protein
MDDSADKTGSGHQLRSINRLVDMQVRLKRSSGDCQQPIGLP